jgi:hypothetical protein
MDLAKFASLKPKFSTERLKLDETGDMYIEIAVNSKPLDLPAHLANYG